jgi:hypothetical protein
MPADGSSAEEILGRLTDEVQSLRQRVAELEELHFLPGRQILPVGDRASGYLTLEREERRFTSFAMARHPDFVLLWYRFLNLFESGIENIGTVVPQPQFTTRVQLAYHLIAAAGGTVKLILDAGMAGYYAQAFTLVRHLFETWLRLEYIRMRPDMANMWFVGPDGRKPQPPGENSIHNYVKNNASTDLRPAVERVLNRLKDFNKMAHPSEFTAQQTVGAKKGTFHIGANYDVDLCVGVLHEGASGLRFLLVALNELAPQPEPWRRELAHLWDEHDQILERELEELDRYHERLNETGHWILQQKTIPPPAR